MLFGAGVSRADEAEPLHPFMLEDVNGTMVTDEALQGKFSLVFFGYTSCPDVCPTSLSTISAALDKLGSDAAQVLPLFVTLDPERDTRKVLSAYVAAIDERIVALQGPRAFTDAAAKAFGVTYAIVTPDPAKPEEYSIDHTAVIFFVGPDGRVIKRFGQGLSPEILVQDIRAAMAGAPMQNN